MELSPRLPFNPSLYPATYRVAFGYAFFLYFLSAISIGAGLLGVWYFGSGHGSQSVRQAGIMAAISFLFVLLGAFLIFSITRSRITLSADAITVQETFSSRTLLRSQIAGRRILPTQYASTLVLVPRSHGAKKLKLAMIFSTDAAFDAWFSNLPDLDADEIQQSEVQLLADPELGFHSDTRKERVAEARRIARNLTIAAWIAFFWAVLFPHPYGLVMLVAAALPLVSLILLVRSKGIYQMEGRRKDARPNLAIAFLFPGMGLALRAMADFHLLAWKPILFMAAFCSLGMAIILYQADSGMRKRPWSLLPIVLFGSFYAYGAIAQSNALLDKSSTNAFTAVVTRKHVVHGRSISYHFRLDPWGPQLDETDITVPRQLYNAASIGDRVCIDLHSGALRIAWYQITQCH